MYLCTCMNRCVKQDKWPWSIPGSHTAQLPSLITLPFSCFDHSYSYTQACTVKLRSTTTLTLLPLLMLLPMLTVLSSLLSAHVSALKHSGSAALLTPLQMLLLLLLLFELLLLLD